MHDLFDFWSRLPTGETIHPSDQDVLKHASPPFVRDAPPGHINGPLLRAPIVLCYGNPGVDDADMVGFKDPTIREMLFRQMSGNEPYPAMWSRWLTQRCKHLDLSPTELLSSVAVFNVVPYSSINMSAAQERLAFGLPSVWVAQHYLRTVLIPKAVRREIFLVVARKHSLWGVSQGHDSPNFKQSRNRGGHLGESLAREIKDWLATR